MVDALVEQGLVRSASVREAMLAVAREAFVETEPYLDAPRPIGAGQTISAPHMVAMMAEALDVHPGASVLEVGAGSGYHAAILARMCAPGRVVSVEIVPELAKKARETLARLGITNVDVVEGDGSLGHPPRAPYDRVSVAAAAPAIPPPLLDQLAPGGVLVAPVGSGWAQWLMRVSKDASGRISEESVGPVSFVPLVGRYGWGSR